MYFCVRCAGLVSGVVVLVEHNHLSAAYALEKSVVDAVINGLYIGYAADDTELEGLVSIKLKGKETGSIRKRGETRRRFVET